MSAFTQQTTLLVMLKVALPAMVDARAVQVLITPSAMGVRMVISQLLIRTSVGRGCAASHRAWNTIIHTICKRACNNV